MFAFDESKSFSTNFAAFLDHMKSADADMAEILRANAGKLAAIVKNGERNAQARGDFNAIIAAALDKLVEEPAEKGGL
jgi:hypothetical protein